MINIKVKEHQEELTKLKEEYQQLISDIKDSYHCKHMRYSEAFKCLSLYRNSSEYCELKNPEYIRKKINKSVRVNENIWRTYLNKFKNIFTGATHPLYILHKKDCEDLPIFKIRERWIERLQDNFDSKIETNLEEYESYISTLEGTDLLDEFNISYIEVDCEELELKDWLIIEPKRYKE